MAGYSRIRQDTAGYAYYRKTVLLGKPYLYLENLSYIKNRQEQAEAQTKQYHQSNQQSKKTVWTPRTLLKKRRPQWHRQSRH